MIFYPEEPRFFFFLFLFLLLKVDIFIPLTQALASDINANIGRLSSV